MALGKTVCLIFFLRKVKRVGSWYILIFRTTQKDRKLANYLFSEEEAQVWESNCFAQREAADTWRSRIKARSPESGPMRCSWTCTGSPGSDSLSFDTCHLYFWPWFPWRMTLVSAPEGASITSEPSVSGNSV